MKIIVTGTRGIPGIQGGVETHCEELFPLIARINPNNDFEIIRRSGFVASGDNITKFKDIKITTLYSPKSKSLEAIVHTLLAVLYAGIRRPDILHIHAVGPNILTPFARLLGLKVVMTHHGPDYERKKWGRLAKWFLKIGEWAGVKFANKVIVISEGIGKRIERQYGKTDYCLIPNGVPTPIINENIDYLKQLGVEKNQYIFTLGRFVPEKGFDYLIRAYLQSTAKTNYKLVIAGEADHESGYSERLKELATRNGVILTGFIKGEKLQQLYTHTRLFVLPSFYEGLPISLLEAMSYHLDILASDIEANKEVKLSQDFYFQTGNIEELKEKLNYKLQYSTASFEYDMSRYNWETIAKQTLIVYESILIDS